LNIILYYYAVFISLKILSALTKIVASNYSQRNKVLKIKENNAFDFVTTYTNYENIKYHTCTNE